MTIVKNMEMIRGDTLAFDVKISDIENIMVESLYFSVKKKLSDASYVFQKSLDDGISAVDELTYRVRVAPADTAHVPAGRYIYDLQIGLGADIYTVLMGNLEIMQDVTEETV